MTFPIFKKTSTAERIFILAALLVIGFILSAVVAVIISLTAGRLTELNILRISQISSQLLTFVFPPLLYVFLVKAKPMKSLGFNKSSIYFFIISFVMVYAIMPLNSIFAEWNANLRLPESMSAIEEMMKSLQEQATRVTETMLNVNNIGGLIINLIMIAGLAAIGEELLFRSLLQPFLIKICKNAHIGIIITSAIFSFIHFEFYGFIPRLVMGMLLGYMFYFSRSIWVPMLMHFANNATAVIIYYLNNKEITDIDVDTFGQTNTLTLTISILLMIFLFWVTIRHFKTTEDDNSLIEK